MLNSLWTWFIIISIIYSLVFGSLDVLNTAIFEGASTAVSTSITLLGSICLWNGIMHIAENTRFVKVISTLIKPIIKLLFPEIKHNEKIVEQISMNMVANILGLGNAATPLGLKAMSSLQEINPNKKELSNSMMMLIVINTASIQLIPTTVIAIRASLGSSNPTSIIFPVWIATIVAAVTGVTACKLLQKFQGHAKKETT